MTDLLRVMGPFLFFSAIVVALVIWIQWLLGRHWKYTADAVNRIGQRLEAAEERLHEVRRTLSDYHQWQQAVTDLSRQFQSVREKVLRRDPLDAIVREQKRIGR